LDNGYDRMTNQQAGVALNWYWNPHVKWAVNYVHDMTRARQGANDFYPSGDYLGLSCRVAF
jgi:phosphate-selective porin